MSITELSPVQKRLLNMMDWFHSYCNDHNLKYYMIGGTMLGAVRHQGFIPWDDDIDVGMPRPDYERFLELMHGKQEGLYRLESYHDGANDFSVPFAKLYDTSTTLIEERRPPLKRGLFLDVFPLDGVSKEKRWEKGFKIFRINKNMLSVITARVHKEYDFVLNALILTSSVIPYRARIVKRLQKTIDQFCASEPFSVSGTVANLIGSRKEKELLPGCFFGRPTLYQFEGRKYYGVEQADEYLSSLIGDYMTLPPENERKGHLTEYCDLNKGYIS